eukprot:3110614-Amphidinium_carterae.1
MKHHTYPLPHQIQPTCWGLQLEALFYSDIQYLECWTLSLYSILNPFRTSCTIPFLKFIQGSGTEQSQADG